MKIYLATEFTDAALMRPHRTDLEQLGHTVTSSWIDLDGDETAYPDEQLRDQAVQCIEDILACDTLVSVVPQDHGGRGGRHAEFGMAHALGKRLVLVGEIETVFHRLPEVELYPAWAAFLDALRREGDTA